MHAKLSLKNFKKTKCDNFVSQQKIVKALHYTRSAIWDIQTLKNKFSFFSKEILVLENYISDWD